MWLGECVKTIQLDSQITQRDDAHHLPAIHDRQAADGLVSHQLDCVIGSDGNTVCWLVTDRDIVVRAIAQGKDPKTTKLSEICSRKVIGVSPSLEAWLDLLS